MFVPCDRSFDGGHIAWIKCTDVFYVLDVKLLKPEVSPESNPLDDSHCLPDSCYWLLTTGLYLCRFLSGLYDCDKGWNKRTL